MGASSGGSDWRPGASNSPSERWSTAASSSSCARSPDGRIEMTTNDTPALREGAVEPSGEAERPQSRPAGAEGELRLPEDAVPILPVRNAVLFPGTVLPLEVGRPRSI